MRRLVNFLSLLFSLIGIATLVLLLVLAVNGSFRDCLSVGKVSSQIVTALVGGVMQDKEPKEKILLEMEMKTETGTKVSGTVKTDGQNCSRVEQAVEMQEKAIGELRERYSDLLTELGIWVTVLTGVMAVVTIILEFMFHNRAEKRYQEMEDKLKQERKRHKEIQLKEEYNHACMEVWSIHTVLRLTTPMVNDFMADMLEAAEKLLEYYDKTDKELEKKKEDPLKRRRVLWLQMYRTLNYVLPILNSRYGKLDIQAFTTLNDQIVRFLYLDSQDNLSEVEKRRKLKEQERNMQRSLRALPTILRAHKM